MTLDAKTGVGLSLLAASLAGCAPIGILTSLATTAAAGTFYVRAQTVERTFVAPMPEVKEACRRALKEMAFRVKQEGARDAEYDIVAAASEEYEVTVTMTPVTSRATRVSVNADTLPERDKATALEIINQMAAALSSSPSSPLSPPSANGTPQSPTATGPPPAGTGPEPSTARLTAKAHAPHTLRPPMAKQGENIAPEQIYEVAIREYIRGDFPAAITHLRTYLAAQPDGAERPKALYWLGESLYSQQQYADALLQFETILRDYPQSPEVPRALLKSAHAYRQLRKSHQAATLLQNLITRHPKSREAQVARTLMAGW